MKRARYKAKFTFLVTPSGAYTRLVFQIEIHFCLARNSDKMASFLLQQVNILHGKQIPYSIKIIIS